MSSAWGVSWGGAWGNSWGKLAAPRRSKRRKDKRPLVLPLLPEPDTFPLVDDRDLSEIVQVLAAVGVLHGK